MYLSLYYNKEHRHDYVVTVSTPGLMRKRKWWTSHHPGRLDVLEQTSSFRETTKSFKWEESHHLYEDKSIFETSKDHNKNHI